MMTDVRSGVGAHTRALRERPACRALSIYAYVVLRRPEAVAESVLACSWGCVTSVQASGEAA